jgi:hypothetical protein
MIKSHIVFITALLIYSSSNIYSQVNATIDALSSLGYNRIGNEFWAAGGASVAEKELIASAFNNPANISFNKFTLTAEGMWKLKSDYLGIDYNNTSIIPSYISIGTAIDKIGFEFGYCNFYNEKLELGGIPITTIDQPEGTGEYITLVSITNVNTCFGSLCWQAMENLSLGLTLGLDFVRQNEKVYNISSNLTGTRIQIIGGIQYQPWENLGLGLVFHLPTSTNLDLKVSSGSMLNLKVSDSSSFVEIYPQYRAKSPIIAEFGASFHISRIIVLHQSLEYQNWSKINNAANNVWQIHLGATIKSSANFQFHVGYFTQNYPYSMMSGYFDQQFLSAGITAKSGGIEMTVTALSSEIFKKTRPVVSFFILEESFYQNEISFGMSYSL